MADVKRRAEAEAEKKGLSGAQEQAYVGGVFNRIRQAHTRATTPGAHGARRLLKRAARREARAEAEEQIRYHEQQIAGLKEGIHLRARLDEPRGKAAAGERGPRMPLALTSDLRPIRRVEGGEIDPTAAADVALLRTVYGDAQLDKALQLYSTENLRRAAQVKGLPTSGARAAVIRRLKAEAGIAPAPAPKPKQPATREEQIAEAGGYVPKTPIMELRKLRPRQLTDEQLARDWQSAANWPVQSAGVERRKQALEREMARRREAKAAPSQAVKAAVARPAELQPLPRGEGFRPDPFDTLNPYALRHVYGASQLRAALQGYSEKTLREGVAKVEQRTGKKLPHRGQQAMIDAIVENVTAAPDNAFELREGEGGRRYHREVVPATTPAQPAQPAAAARPSEKSVDFGTAIAQRSADQAVKRAKQEDDARAMRERASSPRALAPVKKAIAEEAQAAKYVRELYEAQRRGRATLDDVEAAERASRGAAERVNKVTQDFQRKYGVPYYEVLR